jgi:hypothetical protein
MIDNGAGVDGGPSDESGNREGYGTEEERGGTSIMIVRDAMGSELLQTSRCWSKIVL